MGLVRFICTHTWIPLWLLRLIYFVLHIRYKISMKWNVWHLKRFWDAQYVGCFGDSVYVKTIDPADGRIISERHIADMIKPMDDNVSRETKSEGGE